MFSISTLQAMNSKLLEENYCYWCAQTLYYVGAHDLEEYLIKLDQCPLPFKMVQNESMSSTIKKTNPQYAIWIK